MNGDDRIVVSELNTSSNYSPHPLLHFGSSALDRIKVQLRLVFTLHHRTSRPTTHTNAIGRSTNFYHHHTRCRQAFSGMRLIDLSSTHGVHDRFKPAAKTIQRLSKSPNKAINYWLA